MARPGITQGQVFEVAETLVAEGLAPTVPLVRERLGSGSFTTLGEHLRAWKEKHAAAAVAEIHDMPEKVRAAFQLAWQVAFRNAAVERGGQLDTALAEARRTGEEKDRQLLALQINNARLEERVKAADERADVANDRAEEYQRQVTDLQGKLAEMARPDKTAVPPKSATTKPEEA